MKLLLLTLGSLVAIASAGCLGTFQAPVDAAVDGEVDAAAIDLLALAVEPSDLAGRYVVVNLNAAGLDAGPQALSPHALFDSTVAPMLQMRCAPCHAKEGGLGPPLLKAAAYDSLLAWPRIIHRDPTRSLLIAKGPHSGAMWWSPDEAIVVLDWLGAEAAVLPKGVDRTVATPPITPRQGANAIPLGSLGKEFLGAEITFDAQFIGATLRLADLTLRATGSTGIHVVHPLLIALRAAQKRPDPVDSLDAVDLVVANAKSAPLGPGLLLLDHIDKTDQLVIAFQRFEVSGPPAMLGGGCKAVAEFTQSARPTLTLRCVSCHGGADGTATNALDLRRLADAAMAAQEAACGQVLGRVSPAAAAKSQIFVVSAPMGQGNHAFKFPDQPTFDLFVQTASQWIVKEN